MRRAAAIGIALLSAASAAAQAPPASPDRITMLTVFKTVTFGESTFVSGRFRNVNPVDGTLTPYVGRALTVNGAPAPFTAFAPVGTQATDISGFYNVEVKPQINTRYQAVDPASGIVSEAKLIRVRFKLDYRASATTVRKGGKVTISGAALPARPGQKVTIESRSGASKRFKTAVTTKLDQGSKFEADIKPRTASEVRAIVAGDAQNLPSRPSGLIALKVGGARLGH